MLGCGGGEDSIEHYAHCRIIRNFGRSFLQLDNDTGQEMLSNFVLLGINLKNVDDNLLTRRAILLYAAYRSTNQARHHPHPINAEIAEGVLQQNAKQAAGTNSSVIHVMDTAHLHPG